MTGLSATANALAVGITYTSPTPVLGGQAGISFLTAPGNVGAAIGSTLTGPAGNTVSGIATDNRTTVSDVLYQGTLKWNQGVHNEMVYVVGNIPSGTYDPNRLSNLSFGFGGIDVGAGYTYLDPKTGHEFSAVAGVTYSTINPYLQYQNGIDFHLDWGASQFIGKNVHVGSPVAGPDWFGHDLAALAGNLPAILVRQQVHVAVLAVGEAGDDHVAFLELRPEAPVGARQRHRHSTQAFRRERRARSSAFAA